jgi:serine/threonine protein kinase
MAQQRDKPVGFKTVQLLKDQTLGIGSYGKVCKAKCDDLLCAAKIIHETLFDPTAQQLIAPQREHRLPMRRFEQECEFLSTIRHPNIVQYLGICRDLDTGLPALLMELMDDSLTHFLESSAQPIPYHIQVNICHDITLALSFLHSNGIVHRDLSSNNVLLIGNVRAKVTDFGMARLGDQNPRATQLTFTMCPGTDVYMPPEAVQEEPVYTEKIDCFSFGVITLQILSRQFPKPGHRKKRVPISLPGLPGNTMAEVPIPETERRQNHISEIDPNHTLLQVALDCLKDEDIERPSAQQLCERVAALKEDPQYNQGASDERDRELKSLRQQCSQQIQDLQQIIQEKDQTIATKDQAILQKDQALREKDETIRQQEREKSIIMENKERELRQKAGEISRLERQLEESKRVIAQFQGRISELEQLRPATDATPTSKKQSSSGASIKLTWREGEKAPRKMSGSLCAAVDSSTLYIRTWTNDQVYAYTISTSSWSPLPKSPTRSCPLVIVNNFLTFVGGYDHDGITTNKLFSLTGEGSDRRWTEEFPSMPTKRRGSTALVTRTALVVVGGKTMERSVLNMVEVMNIATKYWSTAAALPQPVTSVPAAVCGDQIYILGEHNMYTCSVTILILSQSLNRLAVWKEITAPPVTETTSVSIHGRLLAIGGRDSDEQPTTGVHMYNPTTDSWEVISHMGTPRWRCIAAVLPNNQLMVVGGMTGKMYNTNTDSTDLATVELHAAM